MYLTRYVIKYVNRYDENLIGYFQQLIYLFTINLKKGKKNF